ncbi:hypothetical protein THASP1DRAFT_33467 [Thamnocephalis sphaerospora]|uniref:DNA-directed RNA polymerase III subunit RPC3 n=1 Tax=Thamnocephalis sphaerospora TaxID=78915 RepID=A0A4P9XGL1_9FUNG|nr:hypothetical protein THASP1DRAFT_33467 [Thamnocephalis sphaerospora]|eukprot:RKP04728.1 hypothetical protein THASP1DRAFT_33467 [Thamnocephalis sphaerospora]
MDEKQASPWRLEWQQWVRVLSLTHNRYQISKLVMLPMKDAREVLQALAMHGFAELQARIMLRSHRPRPPWRHEVPKTADRAPSRTFFLWHVPTEKCFQILLKNTLTSLANVRQRARLEREKRAALLIKSTRLDVKENPELLSEAEHTMLRELKSVLRRLGQAEMRLMQQITQLQY